MRTTLRPWVFRGVRIHTATIRTTSTSSSMLAQGRYADASRAAERLAAQVTPGFDAMPDMVEYYLPNRYFVPVRFGRWDDVLGAPAPAPKMTTTTAFWRWSR